jgi:hypothetical protein
MWLEKSYWCTGKAVAELEGAAVEILETLEGAAMDILETLEGAAVDIPRIGTLVLFN